MKIERNKSLKKLSTFEVGGRAQYFVSVKNLFQLKEVLDWAGDRNLKHRIFSFGSNVVFPDGILSGLLIQMKGGQIRRDGPFSLVADAGVSLSHLVKRANQGGLSGLETLAGIPGSVGGAIVGNAGAYGRSVSEVVESIKFFDSQSGELISLTKEDCDFNYRDSVFKRKDWIVLKAEFSFEKDDSEELKKISEKIVQLRKKKYRPGIKCPGSFFKNIPVARVSKRVLNKLDKSKIIKGKIPVGYLLEMVGAKRMRVGKVQVADFHGNFILNTGGGTAEEIRELAEILKERVYKKFNIFLEEEVRYF